MRYFGGVVGILKVGMAENGWSGARADGGRKAAFIKYGKQENACSRVLENSSRPDTLRSWVWITGIVDGACKKDVLEEVTEAWALADV